MTAADQNLLNRGAEQTGLLPMRNFEHSLPMTLLRAREAVMGVFRPLLAQYDITEQQWRILRALYEDDALEISQLARRCCILLPSISGILKRLETKNLVLRNTDAADQRRILISLTAQARLLIRDIAPFSELEYARIEQLFGKQKLRSLYGLLTELETALSHDAK